MTPWFLAALVVAASAWHWGHGPALGADDHGQYLLHARALLGGRSYTDIGFIHSQFTTLIAPVAEPPGLPLMITGVFAAMGESLAAVRVLLVLCFICVALVVWEYWRRLEGETIALIVSAWTVVALARLHIVDTVLAELPFIAAMWLAFLIADSPRPALGARQYMGLALAGALAFSFRMAALPLLPAIAWFTLVRPAHERRGLVVVGAVWALSAVGVLFLLPGAHSLGSEVARTPMDVLRDVALNVRHMVAGARDWVPVTLPWAPANRALHPVMLAIAAWGSLVALRERPRRFAYIAAASYLGMLIVLPVGTARYLWPLHPLITFAFIRGLQAFVTPLAVGARLKTVGVGAAAALLAAGLLQDATSPRPRTLDDDVESRQIVRALQREARKTPVRAAFFSPRVLTWETGITTTAFGSAPPDTLYNEVVRRGLTHVVVGDAGTYASGRDATAEMIAQHPTSFGRLLANKSFVLYEVRGSPAPLR